MEENQEIEFYVSAIANPMASDKLRRKILRMAKKCIVEMISSLMFFSNGIKKTQKGCKGSSEGNSEIRNRVLI